MLTLIALPLYCNIGTISKHRPHTILVKKMVMNYPFDSVDASISTLLQCQMSVKHRPLKTMVLGTKEH